MDSWCQLQEGIQGHTKGAKQVIDLLKKIVHSQNGWERAGLKKSSYSEEQIGLQTYYS